MDTHKGKRPNLSSTYIFYGRTPKKASRIPVFASEHHIYIHEHTHTHEKKASYTCARIWASQLHIHGHIHLKRSRIPVFASEHLIYIHEHTHTYTRKKGLIYLCPHLSKTLFGVGVCGAKGTFSLSPPSRFSLPLFHPHMLVNCLFSAVRCVYVCMYVCVCVCRCVHLSAMWISFLV